MFSAIKSRDELQE